MTSRQGWWMTLFGGLLLCGLLLTFGCASGKASRNQVASSPEPWPINYSYKFPVSQRVAFGDFTSSDIGPSVTRGGGTSIGVGQVSHRSTQRSQKLAFSITDREDRRAQLVSHASIDRSVVDLGRINLPADAESAFVGTITVDGGAEWTLALAGLAIEPLKRQPIQGQLTRQNQTLVIRESRTSSLMSLEVEFEAERRVVGRWWKRPLKESIWIDDSLSPEDRLAIATATTAISLSIRQSDPH